MFQSRFSYSALSSQHLRPLLITPLLANSLEVQTHCLRNGKLASHPCLISNCGIRVQIRPNGSGYIRNLRGQVVPRAAPAAKEDDCCSIEHVHPEMPGRSNAPAELICRGSRRFENPRTVRSRALSYSLHSEAYRPVPAQCPCRAPRLSSKRVGLPCFFL